MPKIELPPQVKCWRCIDGRITVVVGCVETGPDIPEKMVGKPLYGFKPCDCDDSLRYVFDDLAWAVLKVPNISYKVYPDSDTTHLAQILDFPTTKKFYGKGPNPTTALLNAIEKFNADAR